MISVTAAAVNMLMGFWFPFAAIAVGWISCAAGVPRRIAFSVVCLCVVGYGAMIYGNVTGLIKRDTARYTSSDKKRTDAIKEYRLSASETAAHDQCLQFNIRREIKESDLASQYCGCVVVTAIRPLPDEAQQVPFDVFLTVGRGSPMAQNTALMEKAQAAEQKFSTVDWTVAIKRVAIAVNQCARNVT